MISSIQINRQVNNSKKFQLLNNRQMIPNVAKSSEMLSPGNNVCSIELFNLYFSLSNKMNVEQNSTIEYMQLVIATIGKNFWYFFKCSLVRPVITINDDISSHFDTY